MVRKLVYTVSAILILIIAVSVYCYYDITRLHVHLSAISPDGSKVAMIAWERVGTHYTTVLSSLIVKDRKTDSVLLRRELMGKDEVQDITPEFLGLSWDSNKVILEVRGRTYDGPTVFEVK